MAFLGQEEQIREFQDRFRYLYVAVFIALGILVSRLVYLQILTGDKMRQYSEENRIKRVKVDAPRGMIFDRNRKLLIDNRPAFDLEIIPQYLKESKQTAEVISLLSKLINIPEKDIYATLERNRGQASFMPVKIKEDLSRDEVAVIESWKIEMPGVEVRQEIKRTNVYGDIGSHLLGYIGEVTSSELPTLNKGGKSIKYKQGDSVGKFGLELRMEDVLRGIGGEEIKEVDALGRIKLDKGRGRVLDSNPDRPALPGKNLVLTIDQDLQLAATKAFGDKVGSVVAIDPKTGAILAMLSRPAFDPTVFSRGIPVNLWNTLIRNPHRPLTDKSIQDHYPPGSTFKIITAIAGLEEGVIDEHSTFHCSGNMRVGNRTYHCWSKHGHGSINVVSAIAQSCDVFFYRVAMKLKSVDDIAKWANHLGLGQKTGVPLQREVPGLIPTEAWKKKRYNQPWNAGESLSVAIGQSFVLVTALQLTNAYAAIGNGGKLWRPFVVKSVESYEGQVLKEFQPEEMGQTELHAKTVELIKQGLWGVINSPQGTAFAQRLPGMDFVGKTGTVQTKKVSADKIYQKCEVLDWADRYHAMFAGFAPLHDPVIAVGVIGEHACHGGSSAAPIAKAIIKTYLEKYYPDLYSEKAVAARLKAMGHESFQTAKTPPRAVSDEEDVTPDLNEDLPDSSAAPALPPPLAAPTGEPKRNGTGASDDEEEH